MNALQARALRNVRHLPWLLLGVWAVLIGGVWAGWWAPRASWMSLLFATVVTLVAVNAWARWRRERVVREGALPLFLKRKLREAYPQLDQKDAELVERGLRQFFMACLRSRGQFVAMPSRAADAMWHEFILYTQGYRSWCALALGRFLHHTPAEVLGPQARRNDGLRRAWYWACREESIDPRKPTRLPLLFALDGKLQIAGGFHYVPDCHRIARQGAEQGFAYCATDFSDGSASGDADGFGSVEVSLGVDGGGDGCGGGCGGD